MAARLSPGPRGHEFYPSTNDHLAFPNNIPRRYEDNESDNQDYGHNRYTSESNHGAQDGEHYYDYDSAYDPYGTFSTQRRICIT